MRNGRYVCAWVLAAISLCLNLHYANAQVRSITGADQYFGASEATNTIDVLQVEGSANDTVFIELKQGTKTIASHLAFTLGEDGSVGEDGSGQTDGSYTGVASVSIANYNPADSFSILVYADRMERQLLFEGSLEPVYAQIEGQDSAQLVAVRTVGSDERAFSPLGNISFGGRTYRLSSSQPVSTNPLTYAYESAGEASEVEAYLSYVNDEGAEVARDELGTLSVGEHVSVEVPAVVRAANGTLFRTMSFSTSLTASNPGTSQYVIACKEVSSTEVVGSEGYAYLACIHLNDTNGNRLADDSVNVNMPFLYTPPARLHLSNPQTGLVDTYMLSGDNPALSAEGVLALNPASEPVEGDRQDIQIAYDKLGEKDATTWTVVLLNGSVDPKDPRRVIARNTMEVAPGQTQTYKPEKTITVDGVAFVLVSSTKDEYSFEFGVGDDPVTNIYYVPADYVAPEPYDIEVRYVNIANDEVLQAHTLTARPQDRDELEITSPESFTLNGIEYVRLDGQDKPIFHSYYSSNRIYNIYYRDINDELSGDIVITTIDVEYVDGPERVTYVDGGTIYTYVDGGYTSTDGGTTTTYVDGGTTYVEGPESVTYVDGGETYTGGGTTVRTVDGGTTSRDGGTTTTDLGTTYIDGGVTTGYVAGAAIPRTEGMRTVGNGSSRTVTDSSGRDTNTMRIEDNETPLAGPSATNNNTNGSEVASSKIDSRLLAVLGVLAALAVGLFLLFLFFKRRKKDDEGQEDEQGDPEA